MNRRIGLVYLACYIATIPLANWTLAHFGIVTIWGLAVPSGVLWVGLAFTLRDLAQNQLGRWPIVAGIIAGAVLSWFIAPAFALASATAFGLGELADFAIYTPLREENFLAAVALSNTVGLFIDSVLFLWLAFHSLAFLPGQLVGKGVMTLLALAVLYPVRKARAVA